jgi:serine protease Do
MCDELEVGGPARAGRASAGTIAVGFATKPVESGRDLSRAVAAMRPGTQASLTVIRDGKPQELTVVIGQRSDEQTARSAAPDGMDDGKRLGLALSPIPEAARGQPGLEPGMSGVLIQRVDPNTPAAEAGLRQGDVIVSANNQPVSAPADVAKAWTDAQGQKRPVLLRVKREDQYLFVAVKG